MLDRLRRTTAVAGLVLLFALGACTAGKSPSPSPSPSGAQSSPDQAAAALAAALAKKDVSTVPFTGVDSKVVNADLSAALAGMGPLSPAVTVSGTSVQGNTATASLQVSWTFPGVPQTWSYSTSAQLALEGGTWKARWHPTLVEPDLAAGTRLASRRLYAERGKLLGEGGQEIVVNRSVARIGIDKARLGTADARESATRLAKLVRVDAKSFAIRVTAAGPSAFVEAITFRIFDKQKPSNAAVYRIPGAVVLEAEAMLAPTRDFARPIIGSVGPATKEIVDASGGAVVDGDQVGLSGLQRRYDVPMRGTPGVRVQIVAAGGASASPSPSASTTPVDPKTVFEAKALRGKDLETTLNPTLQGIAEKILRASKPATALVAIQPSTGAIVAAANNDATNGQSIATVGQPAPGSTFKVISSLALLRAGLTPDAVLNCPSTLTVDGRKYKNYSDFPSNRIGEISLRSALALSCNTAFISQRDKAEEKGLAEAAGSLGVGIDYDTGFPSFFGSVPDATTETGKAESMIGQGKVEASPMAMAAVVASVEAGHTVIPYLIKGRQPKAKGAPLSKSEAAALRSMMRSVVTSGTGSTLLGLAGGPVIAKTGTAEYGTDAPLKTHAWMIAGQGDLAVAVFVNDGDSGSHTAGPLLKKFLDQAR